MADTSLSADRRSFLAGAAVVTVAATLPFAASATASVTNRSLWDAAMQRLLDATSVAKNYDRRVFSPAYERREALEKAHGVHYSQPGRSEKIQAFLEQHPKPEFNAICEEYERLIAIQCDEEASLMKMAAPDRKALRWKLDTLFEPEQEATPTWDMKYVRQTVADYNRLLGDA